MEQRTVVAVFDNASTAETAIADLERYGVSRDQVSVHSGTSAAGTTNGSTQHEGGFSAWIKRVFGTEDETDYHRAYNKGNTVVAVQPDDSQLDEVVEILDRYNPVDIEEKSSAALAGGTTRAVSSSAASPRSNAEARQDEGSAVPVVEEEFALGKRSYQRGGVRVVSRVVEKPVTETVQLRDERVFVDRQAVNRSATAEDLRAGADQVIELEEYAEEPVVEKRARVVEEVRVGKNISERSETIHDTVRHTEVDVQQLNPSAATTSKGSLEEDAFRQDFQQKYSATGEQFDSYGPAYEYGYSSRSNPEYRDRSFSEVEPQLRSSYEKKYPNSAWDKMKNAVQYGWDRVTGKA